MKIILVGINHDNAPVELRERLAFHPDHLPKALAKLTQPNGNVDSDIVEAVILSTCNRVEVYAAVKDAKAGMKRIEEFLASSHNLPVSEFKNFLSRSVDLGVVEHLFSVASGIKSMVLGENQIQRQVKEAFDVAKKLQTVGPLLSSLFRNATSLPGPDSPGPLPTRVPAATEASKKTRIVPRPSEVSSATPVPISTTSTRA